MHRPLGVLLLSLSLIAAGPSPAIGGSGYRDSFVDPDDLPRGRQVGPDIRGSTRKVWTDAFGRRWLSITIRAYERLGDEWYVQVSIDSRGPGRRDGLISFIKRPDARPYCGLHFFVEDTWAIDARQVRQRATCTTRLDKIRPTKRIRWWVRSPYPGRGLPVDRAPDRGWST